MTHSDHGHRHWDDPTNWSKEILQEPVLAPATEALLDAIPVASGQRLLDLACGLGHTTAVATARGADALGIDLSEKRIAAARARFPHARFQVGDAALPPAGPWDAIICRFGAHHLSQGWARAACAVLVPGGRLAIAEWPPRDERDRESGMRPVSHWEAVFEAAGLKDLQVDAVAMPPPDGPELDRRREVLIITGQKGSWR